MERWMITAICICLAAALAIAGCTGGESTDMTPETGLEMHTVTDMIGRDVEIPVSPDTVISTSPTTTMMVYMVAPDKLVGWNFENSAAGNRYIPQKYASLPVVGGWFGKTSGNYEQMISYGPDLIVDGANCQGDLETTVFEHQEKFGEIPVFGVLATNNATAFEEPLTCIGEICGEQEKAASLIAFYRDVLGEVTERTAGIPEEERVRVYYAEGPKGLMTDPSGSFHSELIDVCNGVNVAECPIQGGMGKTAVSLEQVLSWNPEVVITDTPAFAEEVMTDTAWAEVDAVKNNRVYATPYGPFCWFNSPPSTNLIPGMLWTGETLYPEKFAEYDTRGKISEFYSEFYHIEVTPEELDELMGTAAASPS